MAKPCTAFSGRLSGAFLVLAMTTAVSCKTPQPSESGSALKADTLPAPESHGTSLTEFDYEIDTVLLRELGSRLGCSEAAYWASYPASGTMKAGISKVINARDTYDAVIREFFNQEAIEQACRRGGEPPKKNRQQGIARLIKHTKAKYPDKSLTLVMVGGFGSHVGYDSSLDSSIKEWEAMRDQFEDADFDVWQIECTNSFSPDPRCAKELIDKINDREQKTRRQGMNKYLLWGFSKGGNTILEALRSSRELRNATLAVLANGSPLGGSATILQINPLIQKLATKVAGVTGKALEFAQQQPWAYLMTPATHLIDRESSEQRMLLLLQPQELEQIKKGAAGMLPVNRKKYLFETVKTSDYSRDEAGPIPFFFSVAVADFSRMEPWPVMTVKDNKLTFQAKTVNTDQVGELIFSPMFQDFPLNDTCVALQHAVIPKAAVPEGLRTEMIAFFGFDHATHRMTPLEYSAWDVPELEIVDAVMETIAIKLEGGAQ